MDPYEYYPEDQYRELELQPGERITAHNFANWKNNPTTQLFLSYCNKKIKEINDVMMSDDVIRHDKCQLMLWELQGKKDLLLDILNLTYKDLNGE